MIFAAINTHQTGSVPALVKNGRLYPLPFADMHEVIRVGAAEAAQHASEASFAIDEVRLLAPLRPTSLRDAYAFEQHVKTVSQNRGREVPEKWYKFPVFYYTNPHSIFGPEDVIPYPHYTSALDFELVKQKLNATDPNAFSSSLINLDALIQSMLITGTP